MPAQAPGEFTAGAVAPQQLVIGPARLFARLQFGPDTVQFRPQCLFTEHRLGKSLVGLGDRDIREAIGVPVGARSALCPMPLAVVFSAALAGSVAAGAAGARTKPAAACSAGRRWAMSWRDIFSSRRGGRVRRTLFALLHQGERVCWGRVIMTATATTPAVASPATQRPAAGQSAAGVGPGVGKYPFIQLGAGLRCGQWQARTAL